MKKFYFTLIILLAAGASLFYFFQAGWHPVVLVNSQLVWGWAYDKEFESALNYYHQAINTYNLPGFQDKKKLVELQTDLKQATLDRIVEKIIISQGFSNLFNLQSRQELLSQKINKYLEDTRLKSAATALLGLDVSDFRDIILVPQAEKELIVDQLAKENISFETWLKNQKQQASVYLFIGDYIWSGQTIEKK